MDNRKKAMTQVMWILIGILMLGFIGIFLWVLFISGFTDNKDPYEQNPKDMLNDAKYEAVCFAECAKAGTYELEKCTYVPTDFNGDEIDSTCGEIFTRIKESGEDITDGVHSPVKPGKKGYSLSGDFMPCSTMKVTFHKDITSLYEFAAKICEKNNPNACMFPENTFWNQVNSEGQKTGYYIVCSDAIDSSSLPEPWAVACDEKDEEGRIVVKLEMPCNTHYTTELGKFKAGVKYVFSFSTDDVNGKNPEINNREFERELVCLDWASFPDGISFNQQVSTPADQLRRTKVKFKKEIIHPDVGEMKADVILVNGLAGPVDLKIKDGLLYDTSDTDNPYYYFRMRPVKDTLEKISFQIKLHDKVICTANVDRGIDVSCQNTLPYHCYKDSTGNVHILQDGPFEKDEAPGAPHTPDGLCFYKNEHVCKDGCVTEGIFQPGPPDACLAGSTKRYADTCFSKDRPSKCSYADLSVLKPVICNKDGDCGEPIYEADSSAGYTIRQTVKNIGDLSIQYSLQSNELTSPGAVYEILRVLDNDGNPYEVKDADDIVLYTLDGVDRPLKELLGQTIWNNIIFVPVYKGEEIKIDYLPGSLAHPTTKIFVKGEYVLTANIGKLDTMLVPLIDVDAREKNNKATNEIKVYDKCCKKCDCSDKNICESECENICEWATGATLGVEKCQKKD